MVQPVFTFYLLIGSGLLFLGTLVNLLNDYSNCRYNIQSMCPLYNLSPMHIVYAIGAAALLIFMFRRYTRIIESGRQLVEKLNRDHSLSFDARNEAILGLGGEVFFAFDRSNRKLAICNHSGNYEIRDLAHILNWYYEWDNKTRYVSHDNRRGHFVDYKANYRFVIETKSMQNPVIRYPMREQSAINWCAKMNAIVNG